MPINRIYPRIPTEGIMPIRPRYFSRKEKASFFRSLKSLSFTTLSFYSARQDMHFVIRMSLCFSTVYKVIHPRYSKHWLAAARILAAVRVSVQGVKSLGSHFECLCQGFEFYEIKKKLLLFFKKKMEILLHF